MERTAFNETLVFASSHSDKKSLAKSRTSLEATLRQNSGAIIDDLLLAVAFAQRQKLITIQEVCERTGMGTSFIHAEILAGRFPKPVKLGASKSRRAAARFVDGEVCDWIAQRIAERDLPSPTSSRAGGEMS
ncbi:Prophage CP4-57 regulatory protein (AlpA) [compost metagenome]